jgi:hypothetical protein
MNKQQLTSSQAKDDILKRAWRIQLWGRHVKHSSLFGTLFNKYKNNI